MKLRGIKELTQAQLVFSGVGLEVLGAVRPGPWVHVLQDGMLAAGRAAAPSSARMTPPGMLETLR